MIHGILYDTSHPSICDGIQSTALLIVDLLTTFISKPNRLYLPMFWSPSSFHFSGAFGSVFVGSSVSSAGGATPEGSWMSVYFQKRVGTEGGGERGVKSAGGDIYEQRVCWMSVGSTMVDATYRLREGYPRATRRPRCQASAPRASPCDPCRSSHGAGGSESHSFSNLIKVRVPKFLHSVSDERVR